MNVATIKHSQSFRQDLNKPSLEPITRASSFGDFNAVVRALQPIWSQCAMLDQANKEIANRSTSRLGCAFEQKDFDSPPMRTMKQDLGKVRDVLRADAPTTLLRGSSIREKPERLGRQQAPIKIKNVLETLAKKIVALVKERKLKVTDSIGRRRAHRRRQKTFAAVMHRPAARGKYRIAMTSKLSR